MVYSNYFRNLWQLKKSTWTKTIKMRPDTSAKWDMITSGKWIQKTVWNRWVTTREREQPHKTPFTSTWTMDFLTREGEGRKTVGDWIRDKTISWKVWRSLLQTNTGVSPSETRLQKCP